MLVAIISSIPFFWLKPGGMDLGGDSSRLYFYDPIHYLTSFGLYAVSPDGVGSETIGYYLIPFVFTLALLKYVFSSSLLITLFNSFSLIVAFLSIYGIIVTFLGKMDKKRDVITVSLVGIIGGFFYIFSPILIRTGWDRALFNHNQFFLNPLLFYLLLLYILRQEKSIMGVILLVSFIFTANFSPSPYFFSFFPLTLFYLLIYAIKVKHTSINIKQLVVFSFLFILIHAFHLFPFVTNLLSSGSSLNQSAFSEWGKYDRGLGYFLAIESTTIVTNNLLGIVQGVALRFIDFAWILFPVLLVLGLLASRKIEGKQEQRINFLLLFLFFLFVLFLASAKITFSSLELYKTLFSIPGFGMFRNYVGQFSHVLVFFYTLILSFSLFFIFSFLKSYWKKITISIFLLTIIIISAFPFIRGDMINTILNKGADNESTPVITIPSAYDDVLSYIRNSNTDGKYISFPLDDYGYQILAGKDGGLYVGPPSIAYLAEKNHFSGAGDPFGQLIIELTRKKDYIGLQNLFTLYNIRYIFYNSDIHIYDNTFAGYPYAYVKKFMPATQELYMDFIDQLSVKNKKDFDELYHVYKLDNADYLPHIYVPIKKYYSNSKFIEDSMTFFSLERDKRIAVYNESKINNSSTHRLDSIFLKAQNKGKLFTTYTNMPDSLSITSSVPRDVYTLLHPFLVLAEKIEGERANNTQTISFDKKLYILEKMEKNLESSAQLGNEAWKSEVIQYASTMQSFILTINGQTDSFYSPIMKKAMLQSVVIRHRESLDKTIRNAQSISAREKIVLAEFVAKIFLDIQSRITGEVQLENSVGYGLDMPSEGSYQVLLKGTMIKKDDVFGARLTVAGKSLTPVSQLEDMWIKFPDYNVNAQDITSSLILRQNLDNSQKAFADILKKTQETTYVLNLKAKDVMLNYIHTVIENFSHWDQNTVYLISFDYKIKNSVLPTFSVDWKTYNLLVETGDQTQSALVLLLGDPARIAENIADFYQPTDIDIRRFAVVRVEDPQLVFKKENEAKTSIPKIVFSRINPTKYEVKVSNAKDPYTLIFLDGFNKKWKVFVSKNKSKNEKILGSYFNGYIKEGFQESSFFNTRIFETWGNSSISEDKHYMVNGYANAWDIQPKDVNGLHDYTLILEFETQRTFYLLFFISCAAAGLVSVFLILLLFNKVRKRNISKKE